MMTAERYTVPSPLQPGDTIAIVTPASSVLDEYIDGAVAAIELRGYRARVMPHARGRHIGNHPVAPEERLQDLVEAYNDPEVKAILCSRGGYGCVSLLKDFPAGMMVRNPKWLIGFSDISVLHALSYRDGVTSMHAPMAKFLTQHDGAEAAVERWWSVLEGKGSVTMEFSAPPGVNISGAATGRLIGGNLAVLNGLAGTPFDLLNAPVETPCILFIEDVGEQVYEVHRMLTRLFLSGAMRILRGLVVGRFTDYRQDNRYEDMTAMISDTLRRYDVTFPVAFDAPVGHVEDNRPLVIGARSRLLVTGDNAVLDSIL